MTGRSGRWPSTRPACADPRNSFRLPTVRPVPTLGGSMKRRGLVAMVVLTLASGVVLAQVKPETLVKQRQGKMSLQGKYFFPLAAMAQGKAPYNAETVRTYSAYLDNLSRMAWDG